MGSKTVDTTEMGRLKFQTWQQGGRGGGGLRWSVGAQLVTQLPSAARVGGYLDYGDVRARKSHASPASQMDE